MSTGFPLSGDVSQVINPWAWWIRSLSQQTGFININAVASGDPGLERRIVEEVASYGRQLGWIVDAMEVLVARVDRAELSAGEAAALEQVEDLARRVGEVKGEPRSTRAVRAEVDRTIADVQALRDRDASAYREIVARLTEAFADSGRRPVSPAGAPPGQSPLAGGPPAPG